MLWLEEVTGLGQDPGGVQMDGVGLWEGCLAQVLFSCASPGVSSGGEKHFVSPLFMCLTNIIVPLLCVRHWRCSKSPAHGELTACRGHKTTSIY